MLFCKLTVFRDFLLRILSIVVALAFAYMRSVLLLEGQGSRMGNFSVYKLALSPQHGSPFSMNTSPESLSKCQLDCNSGLGETRLE